jgi:hypothetical protein
VDSDIGFDRHHRALAVVPVSPGAGTCGSISSMAGSGLFACRSRRRVGPVVGAYFLQQFGAHDASNLSWWPNLAVAAHLPFGPSGAANSYQRPQ